MICKCETLNITEKNDEQILVTVMRGFEQEASENESEGTPQPFPVEISTDIDVKLTTPRAQRLPIDFTVGDEGRILIDLKADRVKAGITYGIEVTGVVNGSRWCAIGDSVIRITRRTERGPKQVKVDADPYEVTLWAGYVGDVVPRHLRDLEGYTALTQLLDAMGETLGKKANTEDVTAALKNISDRFREYVPTSDKGKAGGVAALDSLGKILAAQLNMPWRGNFEGGFQDSNVVPGIWGIDGRRIGPNPLHGEDAHGVMLVFPDRYKTTVFLVAPPRNSQYGTAPEIYARRWMPAANSWTSWLTTANFARKDEIPQADDYTLEKEFIPYSIGADGRKKDEYRTILKKNGETVGQSSSLDTYYSTMSQAEAEAGTADSARTITAKTLKAAIAKHTEDKATIDFVNSTVQTATAEFRGTYQSVEELQEVEADRNDYAYVMDSDAGGNTIYKRYKYAEGTGWQWEYDLNCSGFTAEELGTIRSGMMQEDVEKLRGLPEKDAVMPLTRTTDYLSPNSPVGPNACIEPGFYDNVITPHISVNGKVEALFLTDVCGLLVADVFGPLNTEDLVILGTDGLSVSETITYRHFVQLAFGKKGPLGGKGTLAVRRGRRWLSSSRPDATPTPPTFEEWTFFATSADIPDLTNYALKSDTLAQYKVGEEVLVGEWVEGGVTYDLFRKVVSFGSLPNAGNKTVEHGIGNKVKIVRVSGTTSDGRPLPLVTHDPDKGIYLAVGGTYVTIQTGATDRSSLTADVTIEFTREKK